MSVPADSPRTPAELAERVKRAMKDLANDHERKNGRDSLAALVALAERQAGVVEAARELSEAWDNEKAWPLSEGVLPKLRSALAVLAGGAGDE